MITNQLHNGLLTFIENSFSQEQNLRITNVNDNIQSMSISEVIPESA